MDEQTEADRAADNLRQGWTKGRKGLVLSIVLTVVVIASGLAQAYYAKISADLAREALEVARSSERTAAPPRTPPNEDSDGPGVLVWLVKWWDSVSPEYRIALAQGAVAALCFGVLYGAMRRRHSEALKGITDAYSKERDEWRARAESAEGAHAAAEEQLDRERLEYGVPHREAIEKLTAARDAAIQGQARSGERCIELEKQRETAALSEATVKTERDALRAQVTVLQRDDPERLERLKVAVRRRFGQRLAEMKHLLAECKEATRRSPSAQANFELLDAYRRLRGRVKDDFGRGVWGQSQAYNKHIRLWGDPMGNRWHDLAGPEDIIEDLEADIQEADGLYEALNDVSNLDPSANAEDEHWDPRRA